MHLIASSGISTLEVLIRRVHERGGRIVLSGVSEKVLRTLIDCGMGDEIGFQNIFTATEIPYESTRAVIKNENEPQM